MEVTSQLARTEHQRTALIQLLALEEADFDRRLRQLLEVDAATLDTTRVGFWSFQRDPTRIHCEILFQHGAGIVPAGSELFAAEYPRYFAALTEGGPIAASDAVHDHRTSEFAVGYLDANGIGAMMDIPVYVHGMLVGVVCHEQVGGPRRWTAEELQFAMSIGQMVSLAIETRELQRAQAALRASEAQFRAIVESAPAPMLVISYPAGVCLYANAAASEISGAALHQLVGRNVEALYADPEDRATDFAEVERRGRVRAREVRFKRQDGTPFWASVSIEPLSFGGEPAISMSLMDLTERKRIEDVLRHSAYHDGLTGLPNRVMLHESVLRELGRVRRNESYRFGLLYLDLDGFKGVNDTLGHEIGDALLISVSNRLRACLRSSDVAARLAGDEFVVLAVDMKDPSEVATLAARIVEEIAAPHHLDGHEVTTSCSVGIVLSDPTYENPDKMLSDADQAMYRAKEHGKSRFEVFDQAMHGSMLERLAQEQELLGAMDRAEMLVHYQPIVRLADGEIVGFEALMRWRRWGGDPIAAAEFVEAAEQSKLIVPIGRWVVEEACRQLATWTRTFAARSLTMAVNLSEAQFSQPDLPTRIASAIEAAGVSPSQLRLELTERLIAKDSRRVNELLESMPAPICVEDFGTGATSIGRLRKLRVRQIRIDRRFISHGQEDAEIVRAVVALGHGLGLETIAHAVETEAQRELVRAQGCDLAQGYAFAPAMDAEQATALLASGRRY